ncbi:putative transcription factor C2C2-GATA family [Helianthus annuus]|nr:putative transcription factor C2C2-GATA family [Helianthus annuus]KAJ0659859.1 putative transcription factor C2C2-GATA family [Helianthus annuus]KAJ0703521.1 putative transcription factor C2C2-GATA family [Helianthus annuus]KAJ0853633.1 putative transcription factor C2C2-GATA family [Helianthus annuus]
MECVEGASKPNFMNIDLIHHTPSFSHHLWTVNGDEISIDDLLDFPTDPGFVEENNNSHTNNDKTSVSDKTTTPEAELRFQVNNDVDDLDWVSQFVNDSFSGDNSLTFPAQKCPETVTETETVTLVAVNPTFKNLVCKRARSKRSRNGGNVWSLRSTSPLTESSTSSSSVSVSSCTSKPLPVQKQKMKRVAAMGGLAGTSQPQPRRCSHCLVQKTPQWRAGPLGPKTLCNACGVRFKSGRLFPEYRPACSPTFSSEVHSNNHRKVLEMRQKKAEAGLILPTHGP